MAFTRQISSRNKVAPDPATSIPLSEDDALSPRTLMQSLEPSIGTLVPAFRPNFQVYVLLVDESQRGKDIFISAEALDASAHLYVDKQKVSGVVIARIPPQHDSLKLIIEVYNTRLNFPQRRSYAIDIKIHKPKPLTDLAEILYRGNDKRVETVAGYELSIEFGDIVVLQEILPEVNWGYGRKMNRDQGWFSMECVDLITPNKITRERVAMMVTGPRFRGDMSEFVPRTKDSAMFVESDLSVPTEDRDCEVEIPDEEHPVPPPPDPIKDNVPPRTHAVLFSLLLVLIQIGTLIATIVYSKPVDLKINPMFGPSFNTLKMFQSAWPESIKHGNVHRLVLGMVIPSGVIQLGVNLLFHLLGCMRLEFRIGWKRTALIFITAGILGNLSACVFASSWLQSSSSPSVIATSTALAIHKMHAPHASTVVRLRELFILILTLFSLFVLGIFPGSSNWANIAGLVTGLLLSAWMISVPYHLLPPRHVPWGVLSVIALLTATAVLFIVFYFFVDPEEPWCAVCMRMSCFDLYDWCDATWRLRRA